MIKKYSATIAVCVFGMAFSQWTPVAKSVMTTSKYSEGKSYELNIGELKKTLKNVSQKGRYTKPTVVKIPTLDGKIEKFAVYSAPVAVASLAERYDLGSYSGVGVDDPNKTIRFSLSGNDFQSMVMKNGEMQFIDSESNGGSIYTVHPKTKKVAGGGLPFECSTNEGEKAHQQMKKLFSNRNSIFNRSSDRRLRTYRIAISTTGEYTQYFGSVAAAIQQVNATLTRVNFIYERDLGIHLELQDLPQLIFDDPTTDPYSDASIGVEHDVWNKELQNYLTKNIGNSAYDLGHLFGASGGGGNAGCLGCVCEDNTVTNALDKGSAFTSPADGIPKGDLFDVDYVAHEIGHQIGGTHTFSHILEGAGTNVEPGSGSTVMGYAGITYYNVQDSTDPYFHATSIAQILETLTASDKLSCGTTTSVQNNPPVIQPIAEYTIPHSTAFVLTASATDPENDPLTYTWEQVDDAYNIYIFSINSKSKKGAFFRSIPPSTSPTRYFPRLSSVMQAKLIDNKTTWETVPTIAREMNFEVTVRDNHSVSTEQQTASYKVKVTAGSSGPFNITATSGDDYYAGINNTLKWQVANTNQSPYNVENVKVSYTTDSGETWVTLLESTPNDGEENIVIPVNLLGQTSLQFRIEAIGNIFYAVSPKVDVVMPTTCSATTPINISVSDITTTSATISWDEVPLISSYTLQYRKAGTINFTFVNSTDKTITLSSLEAGQTYEYQVKSSCSDSDAEFSSLATFTTEDDPNLVTDVDTAKSTEIKVYPNPFTTSVFVTNVDDATPYKVYDMGGRLVKTGKTILNEIKLEQLKPSVYLLEIGGKRMKITKQ